MRLSILESETTVYVNCNHLMKRRWSSVQGEQQQTLQYLLSLSLLAAITRPLAEPF